MTKLYGAKCHLCEHLSGPTHDHEPDIWPLREVVECERCLFCQEEAFGRFVMEHVSETAFSSEVIGATRAFKARKPHPLIDELRSECLALQENGA